MSDCQEELAFFMEKAFVKPSESVTVIEHFNDKYTHPAERVLCFVFGEGASSWRTPNETTYKAILLPNLPGWIDFYVSFDGIIPISQIIKLQLSSKTVKSAVDLELEQRIGRMLVRGEKEGDDLCRKLLQCDNVNTHSEIILRKYLKDWVFESYRTYKPFDIHGLAVMHLCACLGYTWAITLYRLIGFGVDYRGLNRWTALHGRQGATTLLFFHGANPSLVTKPNAEHPCESTTADIASECGHNDLAAYLTDIMENLEKIVRLSTLRAKLVGVKRSL